MKKIILMQDYENKSCANQLAQWVRELEASLMSRVFRLWNHTAERDLILMLASELHMHVLV